jgi:hypothetical protein
MTTKKQTLKKTELEKQYEEFFEPIIVWPESSDNYSLAQPSPLKTVASTLTYSVCEEPILGKQG